MYLCAERQGKSFIGMYWLPGFQFNKLLQWDFISILDLITVIHSKSNYKHGNMLTKTHSGTLECIFL